VTLAAKNSYLGRVFLDWAKYPVAETEVLQPPEEGYIVHLQDLRYMRIPNAVKGRRRPLAAGIKLDKNLQVVGDVYETSKGQILVPEPGQKENPKAQTVTSTNDQDGSSLDERRFQH
jgi:hypothetical protein